MRSHNPENERVKRRYLTYLNEAKRQSESSLDAVAKALNRFEVHTGYREFKLFKVEQAIAFKRRLGEQVSERTGEPLSKATLYSTQNALRNFFQWLAGEPGFRSRLTYSDAEYFNLPAKDARIATAHRDRAGPTMEQVQGVISTMPCQTDIERRNRALIAFTILTGVRDRAIASLKLKHVHLAEGLVEQDAREVKTKASKTITTWFFPVPDSIRQVVIEWVDYLREDQLWGLNDPLFPATKVAQDSDRRFVPSGLARKHWSSAAPIRGIFKAAFAEAGLPYCNPHSFRKTLARLGEELARTPEEFKAWSQNLGHEQVMTTFTSYGAVGNRRQGEIMRELGAPRPQTFPTELIKGLAEAVSKELSAK